MNDLETKIRKSALELFLCIEWEAMVAEHIFLQNYGLGDSVPYPAFFCTLSPALQEEMLPLLDNEYVKDMRIVSVDIDSEIKISFWVHLDTMLQWDEGTAERLLEQSDSFVANMFAVYQKVRDTTLLYTVRRKPEPRINLQNARKQQRRNILRLLSGIIEGRYANGADVTAVLNHNLKKAIALPNCLSPLVSVHDGTVHLQTADTYSTAFMRALFGMFELYDPANNAIFMAKIEQILYGEA